MINPEPYIRHSDNSIEDVLHNPTHFFHFIERAQRHTRQGIKQEEIQPGNMKVWSDPFGRKKKEDGDS
ncbi:Small integral membrane protein 20 [Orchesella cincta]|uniref:Small integral membrane protein 20 n=1 Tax=Orchesella cincta TaxID=48709 RepID=A0A1D2M7V9_ORCCI|nr:Small integral membrane protein 20 [Orchesella cincta]